MLRGIKEKALRFSAGKLSIDGTPVDSEHAIQEASSCRSLNDQHHSGDAEPERGDHRYAHVPGRSEERERPDYDAAHDPGERIDPSDVSFHVNIMIRRYI